MEQCSSADQVAQAFELFSKGECDQSLSLLEEIVLQHPSHFEALNGAGIVAYQLRDISKALGYLERAQSVNPEELSCYHNLAGILLQSNRLKEAGEIIDRGLKLKKNDADLLQMRQNLSRRCVQLQSQVAHDSPGPSQGYEAWITYCGNQVKKTYKPIYFLYNRDYKRRGEAYFLKRYASSFFIQAIALGRDSIIMQNGGRAIGTRHPGAPRKYQIQPESLNLLKLVVWLQELREELNRLGLKHRDINPTNILYHPGRDEYRLIDLNWMITSNDPDGPETHPDTLNEYASDDEEAIRCLSIEAVQALVGRIHTQRRYDGSSVRPGWVYHPLAFDEFKAPVHKTTAIEECEELVRYARITHASSARILEIGSSVGYFSFKLAELGCTVTAFEADPDACRVAEAMRVFKQIKNITFHNRSFDLDALSGLNKVFDITLMLNVHMWIHKLLGPDETIKLMQGISRTTKKLFFQTAHAQSGGMYLVKELKTSADIKAYLEKCAFTNVRHLRDTAAHGGIRSLFICDGGEFA